MSQSKILLLGSSGMLGQNILEKKTNYQFIAPNREELDLLDYKKIKTYILKNKPKTVVNLAALVGGVKFNSENQLRMLNENIEISKNVIMAAHECKIKKLINMSSSCIYPPLLKKRMSDENSLLTGKFEKTNEGYALAKVYAIKLCEYLNQTNKNLSYKTIIACNLYGKYEKFDENRSHLISAAILKIFKAKIKKKTKVTIWGSGNQKREFLYAEDLVDFIFYCLRNFDRMPDIINCGYGKSFTVKKYYQLIAKALDFKGKFLYDKKKLEGQKNKLLNVKLMKKFGWYPKTKLIKGINQTIKFFLKNEKKKIFKL